MQNKIKYEAITFDDILLLPNYSDVDHDDLDMSTNFTKNIRMNIPLVSSPMDTVTESKLAVALAQVGGIGCIHRNLDIKTQALEVEEVKRSENGIITDPVTLPPTESTDTVRATMREKRVSGIPIVEEDGTVVGIVTSRDMQFLPEESRQISHIMTADNLVTAPPETSLEDAKEILNRARVEKLILVRDGKLKGLITMADIEKTKRFPNGCHDDRGRLRVAAAVGVMDLERVERLVANDVDAICVDTSHGHKGIVVKTIREIKKNFAIDVIAGNIATAAGAKDLAEAGADALRVGIGPGSICTTRVVTGIGVPQVSAIHETASVANTYGIPVIADGGIRHSGDITKALAAGASCVMMGSLFAGMDESPGEIVIYRGRRFKTYRGMGSMDAMLAGSADRYNQRIDPARGAAALVPEGVVGRIPYRGPLGDYVTQLLGGLRSGMDHCGAGNIAALREKSRFIRVSAATLAESHPHDITITQESPNYSLEFRASPEL